jgi:hypothetical protein
VPNGYELKYRKSELFPLAAVGAFLVSVPFLPVGGEEWGHILVEVDEGVAL